MPQRQAELATKRTAETGVLPAWLRVLGENGPTRPNRGILSRSPACCNSQVLLPETAWCWLQDVDT